MKISRIEPMEAKSVTELPSGEGWQYEPKWDGFRCLAFRDGTKIELQARSGNSLTRYFPEVVARLRALKPARFVLDGELAVPVGASLSFDALQMRLHPAASRIRKLSAETPAIFIAFDCLATPSRTNLMAEPLHVRRAALEEFFASLDEHSGLVLSPFTTTRREAQAWLAKSGGSLDGVIAKELDGLYLPGERAMLKVKRLRTADCVVGGFRYATKSRDVGSLLLGLFNDEGLLDHVGFTSSIPRVQRKALTQKLEKLRGPPGFTGKAPGAPSRWSNERSTAWEPLKTKLVVEVRYDQVTGHRFRHGTTLLRWRPDKSPRQCTFEQLEQEARPSKLIRALSRGMSIAAPTAREA
jgi:ATP-dependent DNA ligase